MLVVARSSEVLLYSRKFLAAALADWLTAHYYDWKTGSLHEILEIFVSFPELSRCGFAPKERLRKGPKELLPRPPNRKGQPNRGRSQPALPNILPNASWHCLAIFYDLRVSPVMVKHSARMLIARISVFHPSTNSMSSESESLPDPSFSSSSDSHAESRARVAISRISKSHQ